LLSKTDEKYKRETKVSLLFQRLCSKRTSGMLERSDSNPIYLGMTTNKVSWQSKENFWDDNEQSELAIQRELLGCWSVATAILSFEIPNSFCSSSL
jgi:hypothetical protein